MTVLLPPADSASRPLIRYGAPAPMEPRSDDFDVSAVFRLLRRRLVLIIGLSVLMTAALTPTIMGLKPVYHAESRLLIGNELGMILGEGDPQRATPLDLPSETERLVSRSISERVVNELKLSDRKEFNPALAAPSVVGVARDKLRSLLGIESAPASDENGIERVLQAYFRALTVRRDAVTNVIQIGFDSEDPVLAAAVPNRLIDVYLDERKQRDLSRLGSVTRLLQQRIDDQKARLDIARAAAVKYRELASPVSTEAQAEQIRSLAALNDQLEKLRQARENTQATIADLSSQNRDLSSPRLPLPDGIIALQGDLRLQQRTLDQLLQTYGDNADEVVNQRATIASMTNALGVEIDQYVQSQRAKLADIDREIAQSGTAVSLAEQRISRMADAQTELAALLAAAEKEQAALDKLELQRRSIADQAAVPTTDVELLSPAAVPFKPQGRGRLFYLIGALLASISVAVTVAFIREMLDTSVRSPEQLDTIGGLVSAGLIPSAAMPRRVGWPAHFRRDQGSLFGESIRSIIVALRQSNGGRLPNSIVVTSALDGEGKSFVALSLAMELVAAKQSVLLVESDLVRGNLAAFFDSEDTMGLSDYLNHGAKLADVVNHHAKTGIDYILRGESSQFLRNYLPDLSELKKYAQSRGQILLIDTAPVLASTDTVHLAAQVERTLLISRWAKTRISAIDFAVRRLREGFTGEILVAINRVDVNKHRQYGYRDAEMYAKSLNKYYT